VQSQATLYCGGRVATFDFSESFEGVSTPVPSVSVLQQENFMAAFDREIEKLDAWAAKQGWQLPSPFPKLRIHISQRYRTARSLVPQWTGEPGRMEFPAFRVAVGEANILHELAHIYFPNANRMLAEGLAVYLQQEIGENVSYPDFGEDLHLFIRRELKAGLGCDVQHISIRSLDQITTPTSLMLRVGRRTIRDGWTYFFAGSFVRFLIETYESDKFHALYSRTPLVPLQRDAGSPDRWREVYGFSLDELERQWKELISSLNCSDAMS